MKKSARNTLIIITVIFVVFVSGIMIGRHSGASVPLADISGLVPTTLPAPASGEEHTVIGGKININTASAETLALLPGVGEKTAAQIVAYRLEHGPFEHIDQLKNVEGFGEKRLNNISKYITVGE